MKHILFLVTLFFSTFSAAEIVDTYSFNSVEQRKRAVELAKSLRCPQCQNQNLVESTSPLAYELRIEVYKMVDEGKTNEEIVQIMTDRFGHFVRYNPPFLITTAILWLTPFLLLVAALFFILKYSKKPLLKEEKRQLTQEQQQALTTLLQQEKTNE